MASTWSALKIELLETGQNSGTWGTSTNVNLGDAVLGEAITGQATVDFASDADVTITLTDSATTQAARNLRLNITESSTGVGSVRNLILGSGCQIEKFYLINNTGTGAKTVKNTSGTGISVPAGKATLVFNNGTNVVDAASYFTSLTLGSALPVASGGTGITSFGSGVATFLGTPSSANLAAALTDETGSGSAVFATSPTLVTPNLGTPTTLVLSSATGLPLSSGVTGTLPIANGGTGTTSTTFASLTTNVTGTLPVANGGTGITSLGAGVATFLGTPSSANLASAVTDETGTGALVFATSPTLVTPALGTPASGILSSCTVDGTNKVGYLNIPNSGAKTTSYTLVIGDVGKFIELGTGGTIVVPASVFAAGDAISIFNNTGSSISCTCSAVTTVYKGGTDADIASFSVTTRGVATILFITATVAVVTGNLA